MRANLKHHVLAGEYTSVLDMKGSDPDAMFFDLEESRTVEAHIIGDAVKRDPLQAKTADD